MNRQFASLADRQEGKTTGIEFSDHFRNRRVAAVRAGFVRRAGCAGAVKGE
jgi:hypothetical protein